MNKKLEQMVVDKFEIDPAFITKKMIIETAISAFNHNYYNTSKYLLEYAKQF